VLLWGGEYSVPPAPFPPANPSPLRFLKLLGVTESAGDVKNIEIDWRKPLLGAQRRSVWHLLLGEKIDAACRRVAAKGMLSEEASRSAPIASEHAAAIPFANRQECR
jgi:hypothetical protein